MPVITTEKSDNALLRLRRVNLPLPEVKTAPSNTMLAVVGGSLAVLVLIAIISVVSARGSNHQVPLLGTVASSSDACNVVTADMAGAAFGHSAGPAQYVLGTCVYGGSGQQLIVEVDRQNARSLFDASHISTAQNIPGIGDGAYYSDGKLWVSKGTTVMQIILGPVPSATASPVLIALARTAAGRL